MSVSISSTARRFPMLPYEDMANGILGKAYTLSLVFVGQERARKLNEKYRKKTYVPNVLSFPLDAQAGEIYITPTLAAREAKKFGRTQRGYVGYLFIHGLLHLKGHSHGATMERAEKKYLDKYRLR